MHNPSRRLLPWCLVAALPVASCADDSLGPIATEGPDSAVRIGPIIVSGPTIRPNPNAAVPLTALIAVDTNVPTQVELTFDDGRTTWTVTADAQFATTHPDVPVLGMRPNRSHQIAVAVVDPAGNRTVAPAPVSFTTPALDPAFPPIALTRSHPSRMEPGVTLFNVGGAQQAKKVMVIVDAAGEVVWYLDSAAHPLTNGSNVVGDRLPNGNFLIRSGKLLLEMDVLGNTLGAWYAAGLITGPPPAGTVAVAANEFHHDSATLPPGAGADFVVLSSELRPYPNYPTSPILINQTTPSANVVGDTIVEFKRDGTIVRELKLLDVLDPYRMCFDTLKPFKNRTYGIDTEDWSHGNAMVYDPRDDSYIVSVRNQESIVKIDRQTGQLIWILGDHARWKDRFRPFLLTPTGPEFEWFYHQHAPVYTANGELLLFDNGNYRAIPPAAAAHPKDQYSRAVQYRIDATAMTVQQTWAYGEPTAGPASLGNHFYSPALGDADELPTTGNVLVTDGWRQDNYVGPRWARIAEVTHEPVPKVVFELTIRDPAPTRQIEYTTYRAQRLPSVYPD